MPNEFIVVDRKEPVVLPYGVKPLHPDLEASGPLKYPLKALKPWLHPNQANGEFGYEIYRELKKTEKLQECLSLHDGHAIRATGIEFFREHFHEEYMIPLWKSVWQYQTGLYVACLYSSDNEVEIDRKWLCDLFTIRNPAVIIATEQVANAV